MSQSRQLAAIMFTDIVGYTALMGHDEQKAFEFLNKNRIIQKPIIEEYNGRWIKELGDGVMASFNTVTDAVNAAIKIQKTCNAAKDFQLRIGIHLGEVVFENDDVFGDGVNIASRIQAIAKPGCIYVSESVHNNVSNRRDVTTKFIKEEPLKNVKEPVRIYEIPVERFGNFQDSIRSYQGQRKPNFLKSKKTILISTVILLAVLFTAYLFFFNTLTIPWKKDSINLEKSIAVLPFKNLSDENENQYFVDGMMDEILNKLSKIKEFRVISRTSVEQYRDTKKTIREIAKELGVDYILEGSAQKSENQIKVIAQLIRAETENHQWSDNYTRDYKQIFDLQSEIASNIAKELRATLTSVENRMLRKTATTNAAAYEFYLRGRHFWDKRTRHDFDSAEVLYKKAIDLDPNYALAYSGLADCYIFNKKGLTQLEAIPIAKDYANKALSLDSTLAEALTTIAFVKVNFEYDWQGAFKLFEKVIRSNPNYAPAVQFYGGSLIFYGEKERGIEQMRKALELDPLSLASNWLYGRNLYFAREFDLSVIQLRKTLTIEPDNGLAKMALGFCLLKTKNYTEALSEFTELISDKDVSESPQLARCYALAVSGDIARSRQELNAIPKAVASKFPFQLAQVDVALGDFDGALAQLEKGYEMRAFYISFLKADPAFDPIRKEVRFKNILKKIGLR